MPKRPTIAERTLRQQLDRIGSDIDKLNAEIAIKQEVVQQLSRQCNAIRTAIQDERARNAKP
jgi:predicted  nucleic acid-binding Zn-ribbon protein